MEKNIGLLRRRDQVQYERDCYYDDVPASAKWSAGVARVAPEELDLGTDPGFRIEPDSRIATAGSCFAQNIAKFLEASGFNYLVVEDVPPIFPDAVRSEFNYRVFSARYGNVYTTRQLLQLFDRAFGRNEFDGAPWTLPDHGVADPFRPFIEPSGFVSAEHMHEDRRSHLRAVRSMFETCDVFVFTLGLTEAWVRDSDGSVVPVSPGCGAAAPDGETYSFRNFTYPEVRADLEQFLQSFADVNPSARVVLTVSPVPLIATATTDHVAVATCYSKSVLRAVAGDLASQHDHVSYFPSYDLLCGPAVGIDRYAADRRNVTVDGVSLAMRSFFRHYCGIDLPAGDTRTASKPGPTQSAIQDDVLDTVCDLEALDV